MDNIHSTSADWFSLTQILGHSSTWPEHWHTTLAQHGQAALLQQAEHDFAEPINPADAHRLAA
ncbi:hypothetical protein ABZ547_34215 [Streptomyces sparsogenes]|uniref:hypothetical protein n=1 Tax=Streptomyces sparsogenes TaxID=67365 RepID=UPI0033F7C9A5